MSVAKDLTAKLIWKVYNYLGGEYHHPPKINKVNKKNKMFIIKLKNLIKLKLSCLNDIITKLNALNVIYKEINLDSKHAMLDINLIVN